MGLAALGLGLPFLALAIWFPTMRYELDVDALTLRYGPVLTYQIPLNEVQSVERRDLRISIWSSGVWPIWPATMVSASRPSRSPPTSRPA